MKAPHKLFLLVLLSGTALAHPAQAQDVPPAVQAMLDNMETQVGAEPDYDDIETDADGTVTITKLVIKAPAKNGQPAVNLTIDKVTMSDIADQGDGLYEVGSSTFDGMKVDTGDADFSFVITMPQGSAEDWYIKAADDDATPEETLRASMNVARKMSTGSFTVSVMGHTITADGYEQTWDGDPVTGAGSFGMNLKNLAIPESALAALDQGGMLKQLGYAGLNIDMNSSGKMEIANGSMGLDMDFGLSGKDIGAITFGVSADGVPMAAYAEFQKSQQGGTQPDFNALMPQLMGVSFDKLSLRFEDASLTKRLMPMLATMQGMDEATMIATAGAMAQMGLMQLQNQAFADQTVAAINSFLKAPKSIGVAAKPATPITVGEIMGLNPAAPGEAITRLGVSVSAND
jgi:hypothetical protein